jgi:hypothetical protein
VTALPLAEAADPPEVRHPVDREDAVEVIDLVLEELREVPVRLQGLGPPLGIHVFHLDQDRPLDREDDREVAEAEVPDDHALVAPGRDPGVDQGAGSVKLHVDHPGGLAELGRRDPAPVARPGSVGTEGLLEVQGELPCGKPVGLRKRRGGDPEARIPELDDA